MLINGKTAANNTDEILASLAQLPSSFPRYENNPSIGPLTPEDQKAHNEVVPLYNKAVSKFSRGDTRQGVRELEQVEQIPAIQTDKNLLLYINIWLARGYQQIGRADKVAERLQNAAQYALETKQYYNAENHYKELAALHKQQNTISVYQEKLQNDLATSQHNNDQQLELETRLALAATYRVQNNQDAAVEHYSAAYSLQQGKVDYEAHRVEQHEVGFSNREKIGTDNIQQCVAVIIYDPESKKTALAHVDRFTDPKSLSDDVINKFPLPASGKKLEVYLVGGRDRSPGSIAVSDANIRKVTEILKDYDHLDIKAADIGNKEIPSGIIFDPMTGKLEHAVPGKDSETTALRQARLNLLNPQDNGSKLDFAFDLGESKIIATQKLTELEKKRLVQSWYEYGTRIAPAGVQETWQSNTTSNPLSKTAEEVRKDNPGLVEEIFKEKIETNIAKLNITDSKKQQLKSSLTAETITSLADTKPLSQIHTNIANTIHQNTPQKTWLDKLRKGFEQFEEIMTKTFNDIKKNVTDFFVSSGSTNDPKKKYTMSSDLTSGKVEEERKIVTKNITQNKDKSFTKIYPPPQTPPVPQQQQKKYTGR